MSLVVKYNKEQRFDLWFKWAKTLGKKAPHMYIFDEDIYALGLELMEKKLKEMEGKNYD